MAMVADFYTLREQNTKYEITPEANLNPHTHT